MTDPGGEAAASLAVEAYLGDTRCNAGEAVATYRALEGGRAVTRYYASVAAHLELGPSSPGTKRS